MIKRDRSGRIARKADVFAMHQRQMDRLRGSDRFGVVNRPEAGDPARGEHGSSGRGAEMEDSQAVQDGGPLDAQAPNPELPRIEDPEIEVRFSYHAPKDDQPSRYSALRERARDMAYDVLRFCPESREKALALTKLEEAVMWANAAIARRE